MDILAATTYYYTTSGTELTETEAAALGGILIGLMVPLLIYYILLVIAEWKLFVKAGRKGWKSIIPIYNFYVLTEISGYPGWYFLLCLIPGVGTIIWRIMVSLKLAPAFGKETSFAIGLILLGPIFEMILAFGPAQYNLNGKPAAAGNASGNNAAPSKEEDSWVSGKE